LASFLVDESHFISEKISPKKGGDLNDEGGVNRRIGKRQNLKG
jgi:hypothetical protein